MTISPKPFNPRELLARIRAILRRGRSGADSAEEAGEQARLAFGGIVMDVVARTALYGGRPIPLTDIEFSLMELFLESPGKVLPREELVLRVFQKPCHPLDRSLDMHMSRLRRKLDEVDGLGSRIKTIRSSGYLFSA